MQFSVLSTLILFGAIQGLVLVVAINRIKDRDKEANQLLSWFILLISLVLVSRLVYVEGMALWQRWPHLFLIPDITMFLYGPLFYLYIKKLLRSTPIQLYKYWPHFIPFVLHMLVLGYYLLEPKTVYMDRLMTGKLWEVPYAGFASLIHIAIYWRISYALLQKYRLETAASKQDSYPLHYLQYLFVLVAICWGIWMYSSLAALFSFIPDIAFFSYNLSWVALSFVTFLLAYFAMTQQAFFKIRSKKKKYEGSLLSEKQLDQLEQRLQILMQTQQPFLDEKLNRSKLAAQLNIHPKDLSRLINERYQLNYFDFINSYRVKEFQRLLQLEEYQHLSLLGIAFEAGFNSKTTFNTAFKKQTGMTPAEFQKRQN